MPIEENYLQSQAIRVIPEWEENQEPQTKDYPFITYTVNCLTQNLKIYGVPYREVEESNNIFTLYYDAYEILDAIA